MESGKGFEDYLKKNAERSRKKFLRRKEAERLFVVEWVRVTGHEPSKEDLEDFYWRNL